LRPRGLGVRDHRGRRRDDGTREIVAGLAKGDPRIHVLGGEERRGKGYGIRLGVARSRGRVVGFVDGDEKTPIEELDKLLPWLEPVRPRHRLARPRRFADRGAPAPAPTRGIARLRPGPARHARPATRAGHQCGFKVFRGDVARDLFAPAEIDGYLFDVEILHLAARSGYRVKEVGVRWRDDRDSRLGPRRGNWRNMVDLLRIRLGRYPGAAPSASAAAAERASTAMASGKKP
jgi:dolichyl-phosphate beta-glucosyltransferase